MAEFNVGDVVQLKSGGPTMTVNRVVTGVGAGDTSYQCTWFAGSKLQTGLFARDAIEPASEED